MQKHILTGAVKHCGRYVDESGAERTYVICRGQDVTSLGLPHSLVLELIGKTRPMGGRRGRPMPLFTAVGEPTAEVVEPTSAGIITMARLDQGVHESRVKAGVVEEDEPFDPENPKRELPVPTEVEEEPLGGLPATTPDEAAVASAAGDEPVVSPTEDEGAVVCPNPNCAAGGNTDGCLDETCPVNSAPVEPTEEVVVEEAKTEEDPIEEITAEEAPVVAPKEEASKKPAAKKPAAKKKAGGKKGSTGKGKGKK